MKKWPLFKKFKSSDLEYYCTSVPLVDVPCPEPGLPLPPAQGVLRLTVVAPLRVSTNLDKAVYI